jgi:protein-L-isoaspartate(D-aspartate) O-methyltransferase
MADGQLAFSGGVSHKAVSPPGIAAMFDTATARRHMVDGQIRTADVTNPSLLAAMLKLPRELFVPQALAAQAYLDGDVALGKDRILLQPRVLAKLIQGAELRAGQRVLDVGCGTGYSSAVLAYMGAAVVALEEDPDLARRAQSALTTAGAAQTTIVTGPLGQGWPPAAPYDLIFLNGATEIVPNALGRQLKPSGRLAAVFGRGPAAKATIYRLVEGKLVGRPIFDAGGPVLPGFAAPPAFVF